MTPLFMQNKLNNTIASSHGFLDYNNLRRLEVPSNRMIRLRKEHNNNITYPLYVYKGITNDVLKYNSVVLITNYNKRIVYINGVLISLNMVDWNNIGNKSIKINDVSEYIYFKEYINPDFDKQWWLVLDIPGSLTAYYRYLIAKATGVMLEKQSWSDHITIINGFTNPLINKDKWGYKQNTKLLFSYHLVPYQASNKNDIFWCLKVYSEELNNIRNYYGLEPLQYYHITLGKPIDWKWNSDSIPPNRKFVCSS